MAKKTKSKRVNALEAARSLLARPRGWTQRVSQRTVYLKNGGTTNAYCATGAIDEAAKGLGISPLPILAAMKRVLKASWRGKSKLQTRSLPSIVGFNDKSSTRKKDVMALFDKTIKALKRKGVRS